MDSIQFIINVLILVAICFFPLWNFKNIVTNKNLNEDLDAIMPAVFSIAIAGVLAILTLIHFEQWFLLHIKP